MNEHYLSIGNILDLALNSDCEQASDGTSANMVDGQFAIANALIEVAKAIQNLGVGNAATPMGAIEMLSLEVKNGFARLAESIDPVGSMDDK